VVLVTACIWNVYHTVGSVQHNNDGTYRIAERVHNFSAIEVPVEKLFAKSKILDCLIFEDETDTLSRNIHNQLQT
jgi:hypothetical protein